MRLFKKIIALLCGFLLLLLFIENCTQSSPISPDDPDAVSVSASISIQKSALSALALTRMTLEVTDQGNPIAGTPKVLTMTAGGASGQVKVPKDKMLTYIVTAYIDTVKVLQGSDSLKATAGGNNSIHITLGFLIPALILTPSDTTVTKGQNFTLYVQARQVTSMSTIGTRVQFDTSKVQIQDIGREDAFLKSNGGSVNTLKFTKDNDKGIVDIVLGVFPGSAAVSGNGKIGRIVFKAMETGTMDLHLLLDNTIDPDLGLYDKSANLLFAIGLGGRITIKE